MGYAESYKQWVGDPSKKNLGVLIHDLSPTINSEIYRYEGDKSLLRAKARVLAIGAIKSYSPSSSASLNSWVVTNLKQLSRYGKRLRPVRSSEESLRGAAEVNRVREELSYDLGRDPTDDEIADEIGISAKKVSKLRNAAVPFMYDGMMSSDSDESQEPGSPAVSSANPVPFATEAVYRSLNKRDQSIFDMRTGSHGVKETPSSSIAKKFGISQGMVSQRANDIAKMIVDLSNSEYKNGSNSISE